MQRELITKPEIKSDYFSFPIGFLVLVLYVHAFKHPGVATAVSFAYILAYLVTTGFAVPRDMVRYLPIPLLLFVIGISGSADHAFYDVFKDAWYYLNPPIILCAGYLAMNRIKRIEPVLNVFIVGGSLLSLHYLASLLSDIPFLLSASIQELHNHKGGGNFLPVISLAMIIIADRQGIVLFNGRYNKAVRYSIIFINGAAVFLSFYRVMWLSLVILILFGAGFFTLKRLFRGLALLGIIILVLQITILLMPEDRLDSDTMLGKIALSLDEVIIRDYFNIADMRAHWRGYESYMAFQTYYEGDFLNVLVGHGFGKLIDLKIVTLLGAENLRYIPILHNGYMYLLVKTGFLGLLLHLFYLYMLIQTGIRYIDENDNQLIFAGYCIMAMSIVFVLTTYFAAGMLNKFLFFSLLLLLGCMLSYARIRKAEIDS